MNFFSFLQGFQTFDGMTNVHRQLLERSKKLLESKLSLENFVEKFQFLIYCEEHQMNIDIRNYDMKVGFSNVFPTFLKSGSSKVHS